MRASPLSSAAQTPICVFFFNDTAPTEIYTLSLHDALPIFKDQAALFSADDPNTPMQRAFLAHTLIDRKSTRLSSSHYNISYAVFCLKKKIIAVQYDMFLRICMLLSCWESTCDVV